jgi:hypothetical protein
MAPLRSARRPSASTSYGHISVESIREYTTEKDNTLAPVGKLMLTYLGVFFILKALPTAQNNAKTA